MENALQLPFASKSLPPRGAWIEICEDGGLYGVNPGRSPHGERGLKYPGAGTGQPGADGRSPHGERGLKYHRQQPVAHVTQSLPPRGAWIEITILLPKKKTPQVAPPTGSVD